MSLSVRHLDSPANRLPPPPSSGMRGVLDTLLQSALVELFQAYSVALAPLPRSAKAAGGLDLVANIGFSSARDSTGPSASGKLSLALPSGVFEIMKGAGAYNNRHADWMRELVNQLMGRFKNRLLSYGVQLQAGLPASLGREAFEARLLGDGSLRAYRARTLRGDIVTALEGSLKESDLVYRGVTSDATEGDLIIF